jgi:hypothetical protein
MEEDQDPEAIIEVGDSETEDEGEEYEVEEDGDDNDDLGPLCASRSANKSTSTSLSKTTGTRRKRRPNNNKAVAPRKVSKTSNLGGRKPSKDPVFTHFTAAQRQKTDKSRHGGVVCCYCVAAYNQYMERRSSNPRSIHHALQATPVEEPKVLRKDRRECENHLKRCNHYRVQMVTATEAAAAAVAAVATAQTSDNNTCFATPGKSMREFCNDKACYTHMQFGLIFSEQPECS